MQWCGGVSAFFGTGLIRRRWRFNILVGPAIVDWLVFAGKIIGIPVLAPGGDALQRELAEFLGAIAEIHENLPIVVTKAADHEHDLKRCAHGITRKS